MTNIAHVLRAICVAVAAAAGPKFISRPLSLEPNAISLGLRLTPGGW